MLGALIAGIGADATSLQAVIAIVAALTAASGLVVAGDLVAAAARAATGPRPLSDR